MLNDQNKTAHKQESASMHWIGLSSVLRPH